MLVTVVDVETTDLDPTTDEVIEVAAILYSVEHRAIVQQVSTLLPVAANPAEKVNRISAELANIVTPDIVEAALEVLQEMLYKSSYAVAFNSEFDREWFEGSPLPAVSIPWSDAAAITYPRQSTKRDLVNIALANGVPIVKAHRALDDCRILAELLSKVPDLEAQLDRAARPKATIKALVSFEQKDLAKAAGFVWDAIVPRAWAKRMPIEDAEALPFAVEVVAA